jgi:hypothetical protein
MSALEIIGLVILATGIFLDLLSLYLGLVHNIKGYGASGIPVIPWLIYITSGLSPTGTLKVSIIAGMLLFTLLTFFHVLCQYAIPVLHLKFLQNKQ